MPSLFRIRCRRCRWSSGWRTGCQREYLPHDLPGKSATYYYFALWRDDGTDQSIHDLSRCQAREQAGRAEDPTAIVLDTPNRSGRPTTFRLSTDMWVRHEAQVTTLAI